MMASARAPVLGSFFLTWHNLRGPCCRTWPSPPSRLSGFFFCFSGARQVADGPSQVGPFGRGRCRRRDESGGPPLLTLSL